MQYSEEQQWKVMKQLLPRLVKTVENRRRILKLENTIEITNEYLDKKKEKVIKLESIKRRTSSRKLKNRIITAIEKISIEIKGIEIYQQRNIELEAKMSTEIIEDDESYYNFLEIIKGINIKKEQITIKEFEGLLYLMWIIPELSKSDLFDKEENIYPELAHRLDASYDGENFYEATFFEVFGIELIY